jgi:hypothetical protein
MQQQDGGKRRMSKYDADKNKFGRPEMFKGNFPNALPNVELSAVGVLAVMGKWMSEREQVDPEYEKVMSALAHSTLLLAGYGEHRQEKFNHHLVGNTIDGSVYRALADLWKVNIIGVDRANRYSNPKWKLFVMHLNRFLQFFNHAALSNLISIRATYPPSLAPLFNKYFMETSPNFTPELIASAKAFGKTLNRAAFTAAGKEKSEGGKSSIYEYKTRVLNQLESYIRSAKDKDELLAKIATVTGRMTGFDIDSQAAFFQTEFLTNDEITLKQGQNLLVIFMRLDQRDPKDKKATETVTETDNAGLE